MKGYHHDKDARADAGAEWIIRPGSLRPTVTMAARATGTTPYRIRRALERRGHLVKRPRIAPIEAAWSRTTRAEFEAFIRSALRRAVSGLRPRHYQVDCLNLLTAASSLPGRRRLFHSN